MTLDTQSRLGAINFDHMSSYSNTPHFTNPWASASGPPPHAGQAMYPQGLPPNIGNLDSLSKHQPHRPVPTSTSMGYGSIPVTSASSAGSTLMANPYGHQDSLNAPQDILTLNRMQTTSAPYGEASYASPSPVPGAYSASPSSYDGMSGYAPAPMRSTFAMGPEADARRYPHAIGNDDRRSFADALDASHGMLAMSQETPRAIYPPRSRGSTDSYGFPSTHSTSSSVSSASNYGSYYGNGSMDASSVSDYSTCGSDIEGSVTSRTLPRPNLMTQPPPAPQSMMGQFSSKVSSSTQKKHKCKVCDKRFTRPSSLQTHMYSHTGEKPFSCEVEGCGRHFSVVSNLRRHRKVHKNDAKSETSEDHQDDQSD